LKHAFPYGRHGRVEVSLRRTSGGLCTLSVRDDGIGLPSDFDGGKAETLGLLLVRDLTDQLHGTMEVTGGQGANFLVSFETSPFLRQSF
jgi:two-component sensor histidine kinase